MIAAELALDDALLEAGRDAWRAWEAAAYAVVLGRSTSEDEAAPEAGLPVLRRSSGGGAVVVGPGCLCYAFVLDLGTRPAMRDVAYSHRRILGALARSLGIDGVECAGLSDLVWRGRKFGGSAQRRTRDALLHHGTLLLDGFPLDRIGAALREPARRPAYRGSRTHGEFLTTLPMEAEEARVRVEAAFRMLRVRGVEREPG